MTKGSRPPGAEAEQAPFEVMFQSHDAMMLLIDPADGAIVDVNVSAASFYGYTRDEMKSMFISEINQLPAAEVEVRRRQAAANEVNTFVMPHRLADNTVRAVEVHSSPIDGGTRELLFSIIRDVTDDMENREQLARSEEAFRLAMDGAPQGMAVVGLDLRFLRVNPILCTMLDRDEAWFLAHTIRDVIHPDDLDFDLVGRQELLSGSATTKVQERRWLASDGSAIWVMHSTSLARDQSDAPASYVSHIQDNSAEHRIRQELASRANHDPLTGLINREQLLSDLIGRLNPPRLGFRTPAVLFCDLDHFKEINDEYGHVAGDEVLRVTAQRISSYLDSDDVVARLGGDEFVVVLNDTPDVAAAAEVAERIRAMVGRPIAIGEGRTISMTISVGIVLASPNVDPHRLLRDSDAALYTAKNAGRDQTALFSSAAISSIESDIRDGLADDQFVAWFQPIVDLDTGEVVGHEALARWVHTSKGILGPSDFLSSAEHLKLITDLDLAILEQSVDLLKGLPKALHVSVNVSATTLTSSRYAERVIEKLADSGADPGRLHLELTETSILNADDNVRRTMSELTDIGVRWYVDDFGTGYSSISHLRDLPIAGLKLDLSFTQGLGAGDLTCESLAQALAGLADGLGLDTVAEGIETSKQAATLAAQGWKRGQGWLYGHAVPASDLI